MRVSIRDQLALLVLLSSLTALAVIAIATWVNNYNFVLDLRSSRLTLTANLKAAQLSSSIFLLQSSVLSLAESVVIQSALQRYNDLGNNTAANWARATQDLAPALSGGSDAGASSLLLQLIIYPRNDSGLAGPYGLLNVTGVRARPQISLPFRHPNGTQVQLGDTEMGYPSPFYPNLTYTSRVVNETYNASTAYVFNSTIIDGSRGLLLGPFQLNATFAVLSVTVPIINNTSVSDILGYMTVLMSASSIYDIVNAEAGLDRTGEVLLVGPVSPDNRFARTKSSGNAIVEPSNATAPQDLDVHFVLSPSQNETRALRHPSRRFGTDSAPFSMKAYPAVAEALTVDNGAVNNAHSSISTYNEEGKRVSVGYALPQTVLVDWALLMEEDKAEAYEPIDHLRKVLIACVFATAGVILLLVFPLAHLSVRPIRRLRSATKKSVQPVGMSPDGSDWQSHDGASDGGNDSGDEENLTSEKKDSPWRRLATLRKGGTKRKRKRRAETPSRAFRIPGKVEERKHIVRDELTDLTETFNEMSDELMMHYERLEQRVEERTRELELSKKAAEAANESKTLFIANISHELKTPLNGILGMTAVCMQEEDLTRIKRSLGIIYKSGDLLLHLLTDLLTFSKNQIGQQLSLEEKEFRLIDVSTQIINVFEKQAREGNINLRVVFSGPEENPPENFVRPLGVGRVRDMCLWGDQNRILQVIINLVSNSLKFTPPGQTVELRIRCLGETEVLRAAHRTVSEGSTYSGTRRKRIGSRQSSQPSSPGSRPSRVPASEDRIDFDRPSPGHVGDHKQHARITVNDSSPSPPPINARTLMFEFEVNDSGPGIPEHLHNRVFEPFVQGDLGLSKKYGGTGLGLSICAQLAKLMRGTIGLQSEVGVGSTFTMRIPLRFTKEQADSMAGSNANLAGPGQSHRDSVVITAEDTATPGTPDLRRGGSTSSVRSSGSGTNNGTGTYENKASAAKPRLVGLSQPFFAPEPAPGSPKTQIAAMEQAAAEATQRGGKVRVLVAEDNKVNQEVVLRMLKLEDIYDVTVAKDGQEAFEMVKESMEQHKLFNLIFMDIQMPNVDGLQSTRLIRGMGYSAPIVALTAFAEESNVKECMDSGMDYFLSKPIKRPALKQVLRTYCAPIPEEGESETHAAAKPTESEPADGS
ncbi:MAG: Histidine kinase [Caeruleum heppii]|nr:MAG: Histidine kinase [Caeruleum heppii]